MESITKVLKGVYELEIHQNYEAADSDPVFVTWSFQTFCKLKRDISKATNLRLLDIHH